MRGPACCALCLACAVSAQYKVSREIGLLSRRLLRTMREVIVRVGCLRDALSSVPVWDTGQSTAHRAQMAADTGLLAGNQSICVLLGQQVTQLHTAVEQLMSIKEAATPLVSVHTHTHTYIHTHIHTHTQTHTNAC